MGSAWELLCGICFLAAILTFVAGFCQAMRKADNAQRLVLLADGRDHIEGVLRWLVRICSWIRTDMDFVVVAGSPHSESTKIAIRLSLQYGFPVLERAPAGGTPRVRMGNPAIREEIKRMLKKVKGGRI